MITTHTFPRRARGFSLIEVMVGIVIALIAVLVIYQVFNVSEGIKRNATGAADAQQNGLLSTFTMMLQASSAGANLAVVGDELDACPFGTGNADDDSKSTLRPIPVLIHDSGDDATSDSFIVNYGGAQRLVTTVDFASAPTIDPTADYKVQSPLGFQKGDYVVLIGPGSDGTGKCTMSTVTDIKAGDDSAYPPADSDGYVKLVHSVPANNSAFDGGSTLLNLGPNPRRIEFDVTNETLSCTDLLGIDTVPPSPCANDNFASVPIANNIVLMKVQYGLADPTTGYLQKWVKAGDDGTENWTDTKVLGNGVLDPGKGYVDLSRIKAIRIALVVRSESYDKCAYADKCPDPTTNAFTYTLFDQCDGLDCPAAITGTLDPTPGKGNFRYRVYETIVPLRNAVWNLHKKT